MFLLNNFKRFDLKNELSKFHWGCPESIDLCTLEDFTPAIDMCHGEVISSSASFSWESSVERNGILCLKFWQNLHENDADEAMTSPWHVSIAGVKSSNVN